MSQDDATTVAYEENPMITYLVENYEQSGLKDKLSLFEYCQLHIQADQVAVLSQIADIYAQEEMFGEEDFEEALEGEEN